MKKIAVCLLVFATMINFAWAQNVGIGIDMPSSRLHVYSNSLYALRVQTSTATGSEIVFQNPAGSLGVVGIYNGYVEMTTLGNVNLAFGTNSLYRMQINGSTGNVGIASGTNPAERLTIASGNLLLSASEKGIILNAADRPFITRGFDAFTSGPYNGLGRWGLFMEPSRLVLGMPFTTGKAVEVTKYFSNGVRQALLTIHSENGEMRRPPTGNTDLLPICVGSVSVTGATKGGSGNFTVVKNIASGLTEITITGVSYNANDYAVIATCYADNGVKAYPVIVEEAGKIRVWQYNEGGTVSNQAFSFMVYKLN